MNRVFLEGTPRGYPAPPNLPAFRKHSTLNIDSRCELTEDSKGLSKEYRTGGSARVLARHLLEGTAGWKQGEVLATFPTSRECARPRIARGGRGLS
jgi:hypothetical protein